MLANVSNFRPFIHSDYHNNILPDRLYIDENKFGVIFLNGILSAFIGVSVNFYERSFAKRHNWVNRRRQVYFFNW